MLQEMLPLVLLGSALMLIAFIYGGFQLRKIGKEERRPE